VDPTKRQSHFEFGRNWSEYAKLIDEDRLAAAIESVRNLAGALAGKTFLDIGSGSGLFSLAALKLGASNVLALDLDENSVATTRSVLATFGDSSRWEARELSVFDMDEAGLPKFDVVYSWGVLHHTGDMWRAISCASERVKDDGTFVVALYEKTPLCGVWKVEKRIYSRAPAPVQAAARGLYAAAYGLGLLASGRNPVAHFRSQRARGMDTFRDIHDWMGGYPYESTGAGEVDRFMERLGFDRVKHQPVKVHLGGVFGSGCSEYVYRKRLPAKARPTS
jgi:SAM-dependent methyltransferase